MTVSCDSLFIDIYSHVTIAINDAMNDTKVNNNLHLRLSYLYLLSYYYISSLDTNLY